MVTKKSTETKQGSTKNPHAVALGRLGGMIGGKARAKEADCGATVSNSQKSG